MPNIKNIAPNFWIYGTGLITFLCISAALLCNDAVFLLLPIALAGAMVVIAQFKELYFILLSLLVISVDLELPNGLGLDFPSEPLMLVFMFSGFLYFIPHGQKLNKAFFNHPLFLFLMAHLAWIIVATIFSSHINLSIKFLLAKLWYIAAFTIMGGYFINSTADVKKMFWYMLLPMMLVIVWVLTRFVKYSFDFEFVNKTMNPIYVNHVDYGVALAVMMPFCLLFRKWFKAGSVARLTVHLGILLIVVGIALSYTRAAYISLLIIPFAWIVFRYRLAKISIVGAVFATGLGLAYLAHQNKYIDYAPDYDNTIFHTDFSEHLGATIALNDLSTMERVHRWVAAAQMWQEHPYLGFGPSTFTSHYRNYTSTLFETYVSDNEENSTTHNYFLMTLVEQGVPGLLIFALLCMAIFVYGEGVYHQLKNPEDKDTIMALLISALLIIANIMMADLIETDEIGTLFFLYIALIINFDIKAKKQAQATASLNALPL